MNLADVTWPDVASLDTSIAIIPVGSTEQHGPHAPLGTDALTAETIATEAERNFDGDVVVTPILNVGVSAEHRQFPGTLWIKADTLRSYTRDVVTSLAYHGFDRIVIVNGHGGNVSALREIAADLYREEVAYVCVFTWFDSIDHQEFTMGHAGPLETAMIRHHYPDLLVQERVAEAGRNGSDQWGEWIAGTNLAYDSIEFTENGVVGDPRLGDAELGEELTGVASDSLVELLAAVESKPSISIGSDKQGIK